MQKPLLVGKAFERRRNHGAEALALPFATAPMAIALATSKNAAPVEPTHGEGGFCTAAQLLAWLNDAIAPTQRAEGFKEPLLADDRYYIPTRQEIRSVIDNALAVRRSKLKASLPQNNQFDCDDWAMIAAGAFSEHRAFSQDGLPAASFPFGLIVARVYGGEHAANVYVESSPVAPDTMALKPEYVRVMLYDPELDLAMPIRDANNIRKIRLVFL